MEQSIGPSVSCVLFGDGTAPKLVQCDQNAASSDPHSPLKKKPWPIEDSMYIRSLKSAISTILGYEAFLLSDAEIKYLETLDVMPVHALYLLVRLSLRSHRWHRHSDFARYADHFDDASKLGDAYQILCNRRSPTVLKQQILKPEHNETQEGGSLNTAIDLTLDSDQEDLLTTKSISTHSSPGDYCLESSTSTLDLTFHAASEEHAELADLLGMLSKEELEDLARKIKLPGHGKKGNIITALLSAADTQYTLSHFRRNEYVTGNKGTIITFGTRLRALCMGQIGCCIRINPAVLTLLRRINLIFFRTPVYEGHLFVPAILVASHKRVYHRYITTRTPDIFPDRCSLLEYELSLELERGCEASVEDYKQLTSTKEISTKERQAVEETILEFYRRVLDCFKVSLERRTKSQSLLGRVLERFEPGHVYTRTLHHIAPIVGKIDGVESETTILQSLLAQNRWHCGKRGGWYDRLALLHMKDKTTEQLRRAYKLVTVALLDESTLLRYKPKLIRRLKRLEHQLKLAPDERHACDGDLERCQDVYILGCRIRPCAQDSKGTESAAGKTIWEGSQGVPLGVEDYALEHYARLGFRGKHCEGTLVRFIFALLFHDILFMQVPGAFETPYQTAPLDLVMDTFYTSRKEVIDARLKQILNGDALVFADKTDSEHRKDRTFFVGGKWDAFERHEILEILECMKPSVIHDICLQQIQDFEASGGGVPDLIVWNHSSLDVRFVEVKSPSDKLSETQKLWIHTLLSAGATVEVCHVETEEDQKKRNKSRRGSQVNMRSRSDGRSLEYSTAKWSRSGINQEQSIGSPPGAANLLLSDDELPPEVVQVSPLRKRGLSVSERVTSGLEKRRKI